MNGQTRALAFNGGSASSFATSVGVALCAGLAIVLWQWVGLMLAATILIVAVSLLRRQTSSLFLASLGILLAGYALCGRGFAYVGSGTFFVGEVVLVLGIAFVALRGALPATLTVSTSRVLAAFCLWGVARTVPFVSSNGWNALRDSALWGYAAFAFLVCGACLASGRFRDVARMYARFVPVYVVWLPVAALLFYLEPEFLPRLHDGAIPIVQIELGDACVHLFGAAAFLSLGLGDTVRRVDLIARARDWFLWPFWIVGFFLCSTTRGGLLAIFTGFTALLSLRPRSGWWRLGYLAMIVVMLWVWTGYEIDVGRPRKISPQRAIESVSSALGAHASENFEGSRRWRLSWWRSIIDYTFAGPYFWTGKGFGVNLADDDGYQVFGDSSLRSPHSAHLNVLARMGVPGFALWVTFHLMFGISLLKRYQRASAVHDDVYARCVLWVLLYWLAFLVNMSFDLTVENPHGGIWFWSVCGFGLALLASDSSRWTTVSERTV